MGDFAEIPQVWHNGHLRRADEVWISPFDQGLTIGLGAFETLVAIGGDGTVIGLGNVFPERPDDSITAEVAVLIEDAHQGQGVGTALLRRQLKLAERMGFGEVMAVVLADNGSMRRMLERTGLDWTTRIEDGSATMRAPLARPEDVVPS